MFEEILNEIDTLQNDGKTSPAEVVIEKRTSKPAEMNMLLKVLTKSLKSPVSTILIPDNFKELFLEDPDYKKAYLGVHPLDVKVLFYDSIETGLNGKIFGV